MIPLLVILMITLLCNPKGVALHNLTKLTRLHLMHLKSSKLHLQTQTQYLSVKLELGKFLQNHLDSRVVRGKCLLFLTMSTEISHLLCLLHLRYCV